MISIMLPQVVWTAGGFQAYIESMTRTAQTVDARCYGNCGGCNPTGGPNGGNYNSATETDRVMAIAYDFSLGKESDYILQ